jgi:hypothetical protein
MNKLLLQLLDKQSGEIISTHHFKSLKEINKLYPEIPYHNLRSLYLKSVDSKTKLHSYNQNLYMSMRIISVPL